MGKRRAAKAKTGTRLKVLATVAVMGGTASIAGLGTFGTFTGSTSAQSQTDASGTVVLDFGSGGMTNRLAVGASDLAAGDTFQRGFTLRNNGTLDMASIAMTVSATTSSLLDTDATDGLKVKIDKCSVAWTESSSPYSYTCSGTTTAQLAYTAVSTLKSAPTGMTGLAALTAGQSDHLVATFQLPSTAGNTLQGLSSTLSITFTGTQRAAASK